jgi:hypothetical protein
MPNKKTIRRNKRNNSKRSRNRKGGFFGFFDDKHNENDTACNPDNLVNLKDSNDMRSNYQTCCPKTWYGRKNNSPYCKQLDLNYKAASQESQMETASTRQMLKTNRFNANDDNTISVIDCKNPDLYNTKEEIQNYIESCKCNNLSWYDYSGKKKCDTVKTTLENLNENQEAEERPTEVFNPIQQNNQYAPLPIQEENDDRPSVYVPPPPSGDWKEMDYESDPNINEIDTVGGKRRKTKKHFIKRSIKKRSIRKRSIRKRKGRKH